MIGRALEHFGVFGDTAAADVLEFLDERQFFSVDAVFVNDAAVGVGHGHDFTAELNGFFDCELGNVAGTGNENLASFEGRSAGGEHFRSEVDVAVTGGFRTDQTAAPVQTFAGQHAVIAVDNFLVSAEQETDFTAADADVTGGNVGVRTDMTIQFRHERFAESHDFTVGFALRIEIASAFAAAHREGGQTVFEDLFKSEEFQNAEVHGRMEAQTAFVRTDRAVELHTVTVVDLDFTLVVDPGNLEGDDAFRNGDAFQNLVLFVTGIGINQFAQGFKDFRYALKKFGFPRSRSLQVFQHTLRISIHCVFTPLLSLIV